MKSGWKINGFIYSVLIAVVVFSIYCLASGNYDIKDGLFINKEKAIKIYEYKVGQRIESFRDNRIVYGPGDIHFILGVWYFDRCVPSGYRGGDIYGYVFAAGGAAFLVQRGK